MMATPKHAGNGDASYNADLCNEIHRSLNRSLNWRTGLAFTAILLICGWIGGLWLYVIGLPPPWFREKVQVIEANQNEMEQLVRSNQQKIIENSMHLQYNAAALKANADSLKRNAETLGRVEEMAKKLTQPEKP